jgi:pyruvate formate lyase activating enzyme
MAHIRRYRTYHTTSKGGVTLSGGEPGLQPDFSLRLLETCRQEGIHSALDTSGFMSLHTASSLISAAELILLDIKHMDADAHIRLTGQNNTPVLEFARLSSKKKTPLWVRQVLLPGWTDNPKQLTQLAQFLSTLDNLERLELLPYHRMGVHKWKALRFDYELEGVMPPDARLVNQAKDAIMSYNANLPLV